MSSFNPNVGDAQKSGIPKDLKHEFCVVNSISAPAWGSNFIIRVTEKGYIQDLSLLFNVTAMAGYTDPCGNAVTNQVPRLSPTQFWCQKIEIVQQGEVLQTIYPDGSFLRQQLYSTEDDRLIENASQGIYSSPSNRRGMTIANSNWYLPLRSVFNEAYLPILTEQQAVEIRVWLNPLANLVTTTGLNVTTLTAPINSCSAVVKVTRLPADMLQKEIMTLQKTPKHYRFHEMRYVNGTAMAGVSSYTLPLTNIVGKVASLFFVVRPTASLTQDAVFSYTDIASFAILDGGSTNICGGVDILSLYDRTILSKHFNKSFYLYDVFNGTSNAYVFQYSYSFAPFDALNNGKSLSFRQFNGTENLKINFNSALGANYDVTCFAMVQAYAEQSANQVKRVYA